MRVIQCFFLRDWYKPLHTIKELVATMIQWKRIFPEDTGALYTDSEVWGIVEGILKENNLQNPWDEVEVTEKYKTLRFHLFHDSPRFEIVRVQEEPFIFLDPDVFVFREFRTPEFLEARKLLQKKKEELFYTYVLFAASDSIVSVQKDLPEQIRSSLTYWSGEKELNMTNTGFFMCSPKIGKEIATEVLKLHGISQDIGMSYSIPYHEFVSSVVPLIYLKSRKIECRVLPNSGILHHCGAMMPGFEIAPAKSFGEKVFYDYKGFKTTPARLKLYEEVCNYILQGNVLTLEKFANIRASIFSRKVSLV